MQFLTSGCSVLAAESIINYALTLKMLSLTIIIRQNDTGVYPPKTEYTHLSTRGGLGVTAARHQGVLVNRWLPLIAGTVTEAYPAEDAQNLKLNFHVGHLNAASLFQYNTSGGKLNNSNAPKVQNVIQRMFNFAVNLKT